MTPRAFLQRAPLPQAVTKDEDQALVARVRVGDVRAFETLFFAYYDLLFNVARRVVGSADVAEEVVQEAFVRLWDTRERWELRTSVRAYLYCAIRNAAFNAVRHERIAEQYADGVTGVGSVGTMGSWDNRADEPLLADEMTGVLWRAMQSLPSRTQQAFHLRVEHNLAYAEIAEIMSITPKAVERLIARARGALEEALDAYL